jgi:hypothetical protein
MNRIETVKSTADGTPSMRGGMNTHCIIASSAAASSTGIDSTTRA